VLTLDGDIGNGGLLSNEGVPRLTVSAGNRWKRSFWTYVFWSQPRSGRHLRYCDFKEVLTAIDAQRLDARLAAALAIIAICATNFNECRAHFAASLLAH